MSRPATTSGFSVDASASSGKQERGTEVGEEIEVLAQAQQRRARALVVRNLLVARNAGRAEQDRLGLARDARACAAAADRRAMRSATPPMGASASSSGAALPTAARSTLHRLRRDFGADAVAGENGDLHADVPGDAAPRTPRSSGSSVSV